MVNASGSMSRRCWLLALRPGDIVVIDNLGSHFAKLKAIARSLAAKTVEALWQAIGAISIQIPPPQCSNFIRHSGYFQST
jgi:hypothetical protein